MTARVLPSPNGMWTAKCDACTFTRPGISHERASVLRDEHNEPGQCPGQVRSENPANYRRRA